MSKELGYLSKSELYSLVSQLRDMYGVGVYPVNMLKLCDNLGIKHGQVSFKTPGLRGIASIGKTGDQDVILLNAQRNAPEQNFDCAHEFLHLRGQRGEGVQTFQCFDSVRPNQKRYLEWQANEGAAEMLMPYMKFIPFFCKILKAMESPSENAIQRDPFEYMAKKFFVPRMVTYYRCSGLSFEIEQYQKGVPIEDIKLLSKSQQEKLGITAKDRALCLERLIPFEGPEPEF